MNPKTSRYVPRVDEANANKHSILPNLSGASPRRILNEQAAAQRSVAESEQWLIACQVNHAGDSRAPLEKLGFKVKRKKDELFYEVEPPKGWTKSTSGYWTTVCDETGTERLSQFFKGASYDYCAFVNIK